MIVLSILQRVLVNHFYKVNAGFFLFVFLVLFGLPYQPLSFHLSLMEGIIESQLFLGIVMCCWLLYGLKCIDYISSQIAEPKQMFLFSLNNLSTGKAFLYLLYVQVMVYLPALMYAAVITGIAASRSLYKCVIEVILFCIATIILPAYIYLLAIQKRKLYTGFRSPLISSFNLPRPLFLMPLFYLWHNRKQMLLVTKLFSIGLLYIFLNLYEPDHYDIRPLLLCLLLVSGAHTAIVFEARNFEEEYLAFSKNLPVNVLQRFSGLLLMYLMLMLPEFIFLWKGYGVHFFVTDYAQVVLLVIALITVFHVTLLLEETTMDQFMRVVFGILAALFFIILYNPGIVLPLAMLVISFALFASYYYTFESKG